MAFLKFTTVMAVLVSAYAAPAPQYYAHAPPPPPPPARAIVPVAPPPPPPAAYHAGPQYYHAQAQFVPIVSQSYDANPDGSYTFQYETADGSARQEQGISRSPPGHEGPGGVAVQGRYVYAGESGPTQVDYIADENGYQPSGKDIHPAIVEAVAQQVAFARSEPAQAYHAHVPPPPPPPAVYARTAYAPVPPPPAYPSPVPYSVAPYKA